MNYSMTLTGNMNLRSTASATGTILKVVPVGTILEGDVLSADGNWLTVLMMNGVQTTVPTHVATYTTSGKLVTNPVVPPSMAVQVEITFASETPVKITLNGVPVGQGEYTGTIVIAPVG